MLDRLALETERAEEFVHVAAKVLARDLGNARRENNLEAALHDVPAHDVLGVGIEHRAARDDARSAPRASTPREHDRRGAVSEETRRDHVRDRAIVELERERAELDREEHGDSLGEPAQVVGRARRPGGAGDAAEPEERRPLHVGAEPEPARDARADARDRDPRHGREEDVVHVASPHVRGLERARDGLAPELERGLHPDVVPLGEGVEREVVVQGQREVARLDAERAVERLQALARELLARPGREELGESLLPLRDVRGQRGARPEHDRRLEPGRHFARLATSLNLSVMASSTATAPKPAE